MAALIIIIVALLLIVFYALKDKDSDKTEKGTTSTPADKSDNNDESGVRIKETPLPEGEPLAKFSCSIAGLSHHQNNITLGGFVGYAIHEKNNPYDNLAIAIINANGELLGYVPAKAHGEYLAYFPDKVPCFVVGYIDTTSDSRFTSKAYFVRIHSWQYAKYEIDSLCKWIIDKKHLPISSGYKEVMEQIEEMLKPDETTETEQN